MTRAVRLLACLFIAAVGCRGGVAEVGTPGTPDAGPTDPVGPADAGPVGTPDAGPPPPDPHKVGGLGPGPWPLAPLTVYGSAQGLLERPISASTDEAENLWVVTTRALYLMHYSRVTDVPDGPQDLVAYDHSLVGGAESAIIRRSQNIADNGTITTLDFASVEAFTPATATITLNGLLGSEQYVQQEMVYQVAANCATAFLYNGDISGATFTAFGIPSSQQQPTDFHGLLVLASTSTGIRIIQQYNHSLVARTLTLGAVMPTPTITTLATPPAYKRLQAVYTLPTDYERSTSFGYQDGANNSVTISATFGYGGPSTTLALPDFSALSGWDNNWAPSSTSTGTWFVSGNGGSGSVCTEGASVKAATVNGTY